VVLSLLIGENDFGDAIAQNVETVQVHHQYKGQQSIVFSFKLHSEAHQFGKATILGQPQHSQ